MLYTIYFFGDFFDAKKFFNRVNNAVALGMASTVSYGACFFVAVKHTKKEVLDKKVWLGWNEYKIALEFPSYLGHESALNPLDVCGLIRVIETKTEKLI